MRSERGSKIPPERVMVVFMIPAGELHSQALGTFRVEQFGEQPNAGPDALVAIETAERILPGRHT